MRAPCFNLRFQTSYLRDPHHMMPRFLRRAAMSVTACALFGLAAARPAAAQDLSESGHVFGSPSATIEIVEFLDLGCDQCEAFNELAFHPLYKEFVLTGQVRWRVIPFVLGAFRHSAFAAEAAECSAEQGLFLVMTDSLMARSREWMTLGSPTKALAQIARDAGLDGAEFDECVGSQRMRPRVRAHKTLALSKKVYGTPTFIFPGDRRVLGAVPLEQFRTQLRVELSARRP